MKIHARSLLPVMTALSLLLVACGGGSGAGAASSSVGSSAGTGNSTGTGSGSGTSSGASSGSSGSSGNSGSGSGSSSGTTATGAPQITVQPAGQTVTVGQSALFAVTASGAASYQWSKNGTAIAGATSASYYTPAITAANAGDVYAVTVGNANGSTPSGSAAISINPNSDGSPPASFWGDTSAIPAAQQVMTFQFVNATNGKYPDSQLFWGFNVTTADGTAVSELHAFSDAPSYDMPAVSSARMYFYIASSATATGQGSTNYFDFIEFNIGRSSSSQPWGFNGDNTRVDAFGLKTAVHLHCGDGTDTVRGEDYGTFLEDRAITFQKYLAEVPTEFAVTATQNAPYRIVEPGAAGFGAGGANADYFNSYIDTVWANNNIDTSVIPKPTPFLNFVSNQYPDLTAALERHVADAPGTFNSDGTLVDPNFWSKEPSSSFYASEPANFYARYWHTHGIAGLAYGFPYDDVGSHSSDISCNSPQYLVAAIGW